VIAAKQRRRFEIDALVAIIFIPSGHSRSLGVGLRYRSAQPTGFFLSLIFQLSPLRRCTVFYAHLDTSWIIEYSAINWHASSFPIVFAHQQEDQIIQCISSQIF